MTQTSRLVLEIDSRDAEQKAKDVRAALEAVEDAGLSIKPAMDKASAGLESVGKSATTAKKSIKEERDEIEHLLESINPLAKKLNELERQEAALNKARKAGKIEDTYNEYSAKLSATRAELSRFSETLGKTGISAKQTAAAMRGVPAQITDIVTSLQGGQAPFTVFIQQGGQLKDMFGGVAPAAKALPMVLITLVVRSVAPSPLDHLLPLPLHPTTQPVALPARVSRVTRGRPIPATRASRKIGCQRKLHRRRSRRYRTKQDSHARRNGALRPVPAR